MTHYELLYLVPGTILEDELGQIKQSVKNTLQKFAGRVTFEDSLGKKKLAYPIKKMTIGYYLLFEFDLEGKNLKKLNEELKLTPKVLRHLIVKKSATMPTLVEKALRKMEEKPIVPSAIKPEEKKKVKIEDLDKKLDEILQGDIL